jgi:hypothetical protein
MRQQIRVRATFMSASGAFDHQKILPEFVGKALHLEIFRHERTVYMHSHGPPLFFTHFFSAKTGLNPYEGAVFSV